MTEKKKSGPSGNPVWLKWIVLAFVAYAGYLHFTGQGVGERRERETAPSMENPVVAENVSVPADGRARISGEIEGMGEAASCGQEAKARVEAIPPEGAKQDAPKPETVTLRVGLLDARYPWAEGISGMKPGGVRELLVTEKDAAAPTRYRITLETLSPTLPKDGMPFRVMDASTGAGKTIKCGEIAQAHLRLWSADGALAYDSRKDEPTSGGLTFRLGASAVFHGLDRGVPEMRPGGARTLILPPAYLAFAGDAPHPARAALPDGQTAIAEVELVGVETKEK